MKKLYKFLTLFLAVTLMTAAPVSAAALGTRTPVAGIHAAMFPVGSEQMVDYAHFLNVRRGPYPSYPAFTHLARGTRVTVLEYSQKWIRVDTPSGQGWIYAGYLSREYAHAAPLTGGGGGTGGNVSAAAGGGGTITGRTPFSLLRADMFPAGSTHTVDFASHVNVRRGPGNNYSPFTHVTRGDSITVLEYRGGWARIDTPSGQGWMFAGFLSNAAVQAVRADAGAVPAAAGQGTAPGGLGRPTPFAQLRAENFPVGSSQTVDYCHFLNVRRGPGTNHGAFTHLARGDVIIVQEFRQGWVQINTDRGTGWIYAGYLRRQGDGAAAQQPAPMQAEAAATAYEAAYHYEPSYDTPPYDASQYDASPYEASPYEALQNNEPQYEYTPTLPSEYAGEQQPAYVPAPPQQGLTDGEYIIMLDAAAIMLTNTGTINNILNNPDLRTDDNASMTLALEAAALSIHDLNHAFINDVLYGMMANIIGITGQGSEEWQEFVGVVREYVFNAESIAINLVSFPDNPEAALQAALQRLTSLERATLLP